MCRLDRFLLSWELLEIMLSLFQKVLPRSLSNHKPVLLCTNRNNWGPKPFHLFSHWMDDPHFSSLIEISWKSDSSLSGLFNKLKVIKSCVKVWQSEHYHTDSLRIELMKREIDKLEKVVELRNLYDDQCLSLANFRVEPWSLYKKEE